VIYYRALNLDRASESRKNPDWLRQQWTRRQCRVFVLKDDKSLMRRDGTSSVPEMIQLPRDDVVDLVDEFDHLIFLGLEQEIPLFALDVSHHHQQRLDSSLGEGEFIDLREVAWRLDAQHAATLAYARGLVFWNRNHRYCGICGSPTLANYGGHMRRCSNSACERMHFPRTDPAVIMLVEDRRDAARPRCLLARNSRFPSRMMSTLAGFVDPLESLEETVAREVFEECGIRVTDIEYQASQPWPFPSSIMLGFRARATSFDIMVDGIEIDEAHWFEAVQLKSFGEWGDGGDGFSLPRKDSIARYLVNSWVEEVLQD
jgi:NAD+ diphosphatase